MAFTVDATIHKDLSSTKRVVTGTFSDGAPTGGTITTGLTSITYCDVTGATSLSASGGTITVTTAATAGYWIAYGY